MKRSNYYFIERCLLLLILALPLLFDCVRLIAYVNTFKTNTSEFSASEFVSEVFDNISPDDNALLSVNKQSFIYEQLHDIFDPNGDNYIDIAASDYILCYSAYITNVFIVHIFIEIALFIPKWVGSLMTKYEHTGGVR